MLYFFDTRFAFVTMQSATRLNNPFFGQRSRNGNAFFNILVSHSRRSLPPRAEFEPLLLCPDRLILPEVRHLKRLFVFVSFFAPFCPVMLRPNSFLVILDWPHLITNHVVILDWPHLITKHVVILDWPHLITTNDHEVVPTRCPAVPIVILYKMSIFCSPFVLPFFQKRPTL